MMELGNLFGFDGTAIGFGKNKKEALKLGDRQFSVNTTGKGYQLYFGKELAKEFEPYKRACLYSSKITRKLFFVMSNDERCVELKSNNDSSVRIYSRDIAVSLYSFFGKEEGERLILSLGKNISCNPEFATYEITAE